MQVYCNALLQFVTWCDCDGCISGCIATAKHAHGALTHLCLAALLAVGSSLMKLDTQSLPKFKHLIGSITTGLMSKVAPSSLQLHRGFLGFVAVVGGSSCSRGHRA